MPTFADLCAVAQTIPDVHESTSYGTPALKLKNKLIVRLREDGHTLAMLASQQDIDALPVLAPHTFSVPEHYVGYGMLVVDLRTVGTDELAGLFRAAVAQVAERLAAKRQSPKSGANKKPGQR